MANLQGFNAREQEPMMDFSAMPAQKGVLAMMTASKMKPTKAGTGSYLECEFTLLGDGQYKGRKIWTRMNLSNPSQVAEKIAKSELGAICMAIGMPEPIDSADLHNRPILINFDIETSDQGKPQNKITKYLPATAGVVGVVPSSAQPAANVAPPAVAPWLKKA